MIDKIGCPLYPVHIRNRGVSRTEYHQPTQTVYKIHTSYCGCGEMFEHIEKYNVGDVDLNFVDWYTDMHENTYDLRSQRGGLINDWIFIVWCYSFVIVVYVNWCVWRVEYD